MVTTMIFRRDLTEKGVSDAEKISSKLHEMGICADLVIASPAIRTMHTASIFCQNLRYDHAKIRQEKVFYEGLTTQNFIDMLQELPESVQTVFGLWTQSNGLLPGL